MNKLRVFLPSGAEIIGDIAIGWLALLLINWPDLLVQIERRTGTVLSGQITFWPSSWPGWLGAPLLSKAVLIVFWVGIGCLVYFATLWINRVIAESEDEYKLATGYTNKGQGEERTKKIALQAGIGVALAVWLSIAGIFIYPMAVYRFQLFLRDLPAISGWVGLALATIYAVLILHFSRGLIRLAFGRTP